MNYYLIQMSVEQVVTYLNILVEDVYISVT